MLGNMAPGRGNFHVPYALPKNTNPAREKTHRLMDLMLTIKKGGADFLAPTGSAEFAVVDLLREEKGWFELPAGYTPEKVTAMIESTFAARALQVSARLWVV